MARVKLNYAAFRRLRTSEKSRDLIDNIAEKIAKEASQQSGEEYVFERAKGKNRARSTVYPKDSAAEADNAENLTLLKSLRAGRR